MFREEVITMMTRFLTVLSILFFVLGILTETADAKMIDESEIMVQLQPIDTDSFPSMFSSVIERINEQIIFLQEKQEELLNIESVIQEKRNTLQQLNEEVKEKEEKMEELDKEIKEKEDILFPFLKPAEGYLTSAFSYRTDPITGEKNTFHPGIDIAKPGDVKVKAAADGVVTKSYVSRTYGEVVFIRHNINEQVYETVYSHLRSGTRKVNAGDKVKKGDVIGMMGSTGNSTGQHLHFEIHKGTWNYDKTNAVDPLDYINMND